METHPTELQLTDSSLCITWSDESRQTIEFRELRRRCPCATCREKRAGNDDTAPDPLAVITPVEAQPVTVTGMRPVGSYGYSIQFSDGHSTGIFTLEFLRSLATQ